MNTPVNLENETCSMTVEIHDEAFDDLLTPEVKTIQAITAQRIPQRGLSGSHLMPEAFGSKLLFLISISPQYDRLPSH